MKKQALFLIKKLANKAGYDFKYYHPHFDLVIKKYNISTVFDVGANTGQFAKDVHARLPDATIFSFEPLKDCYATLLETMKGVEKFQAFNCALGQENKKLEINRSSFHPSSSLLPMAKLHKDLYPKSKDITKETIDVRRMDDVVREIKTVGPILVKIDVQGYEDNVIKGGKELLSKASVVMLETSFKTLYEGQPLFKDIHDLLTSLGFSYYGNHTQHWNDKTGELIYEDSIFVRL